MKKGMVGILGAALLMGGMGSSPMPIYPDNKEPEPDEPVKPQRKVVPPRSMTPDELEFYKKYKTLDGYKAPIYE